MLFSKCAGTIFSLVFSAACCAQTLSSDNPLLLHSNRPIAFDQVNAAVVDAAVNNLVTVSDARIKRIIAGARSSQAIAHTLMAFDELEYDLNDLGAKMGLILSTYPSDSTRDAANKGSESIAAYGSSLFLNEDLYKAIKQYASTAIARQLHPNQKKFLRETILNFENNGMKLDAAGRKKLQAINEKIIGLGTQFDRNIAEYKDSLSFTEADLQGVPEDITRKWKTPAGFYTVYINTPNLDDIATYAISDSTRHAMYLKYNNRAYPQNIKVLDSLLYYRQQFANELGFKSYAAYALIDKMAESPASVWNFENNLISKLTPHVSSELREVAALKRRLHPELPDTVFAWDIRFYKKQLLDTKYNLNTEEVKKYFEMNNTIRGLFTVYGKLFNLEMKEVKNVPVWYNKVKSFEMFRDGKKIGSFYFDLYPRPNKYTHFACFPISQSRTVNGRELLPVAALICNFPEGAAGEPSLLEHNDVITLFHEFGHLVHMMLVRSDIASQPFSLKADFVEAPSQFLENWCWQYPALKLFARNYKTGETLPDTLFRKMKAAQNTLGAIYYITQLYYGLIDFTFHDKYDSIRGMDINQTSKNLYAITQIPFAEGTHFICSFGHLNGYAANYYGYLWSRVFAQDMFSVFEKHGVMDPATGIRYRKEILEIAGSVEEMDMLRKFLGREPNNNAFMRSLGLD